MMFYLNIAGTVTLLELLSIHIVLFAINRYYVFFITIVYIS